MSGPLGDENNDDLLRGGNSSNNKHPTDNSQTPVLWISMGAGAIIGLLVLCLIYGLISEAEKNERKNAGTVISENEIVIEKQEVKAASVPSSDSYENPSSDTRQVVKADTEEHLRETKEEHSADSNSTHLSVVEVDPRLRAFALPSATWAMAYDNATGRLAITDDTLGGVAIYKIDDLLNSKLDPEQTLTTKGPATALCLKQYGKQRFLVVASKLFSGLKFFDVDSLELVKEVLLKDTYYAGFLTASSSSVDPYVCYVIRGRHNNLPIPHDGVKFCGRIDIRTMKDDTEFSVKSEKANEEVLDAAVSSDGTLFYHRGSYSPTGVNVVHWRGVPYNDWVGGRLLDEHKSTPEYTPGPYGNIVVSGSAIFSRDMRGEPRRIDFEPKAFFRNNPYVIGFSSQDLVIGSANDYSKLMSIQMPKEWLPVPKKRYSQDRSSEKSDFRRRRHLCGSNIAKYIAVAVDDERRLSIAVFNKGLVLVPLDEFDLPTEPLLAVKKVAPYHQFVDKELVFPLEAEADDITYEIVSFSGKSNPPVIEESVLRWTPSPKQVGYHRLTLRARKGNVSRDWEWPFEVQQPTVDVPFAVSGISIEPTSRQKAVVWGFTKDPALNQRSQRKWFLGVVDLNTKELIVHRSLSKPVSTAAISSNHIYAIASDAYDVKSRRVLPGDKLVRLRLSDLKSENSVTLTEKSNECRVIADRFLVTIDNAKKVTRYSIPELESLDVPYYGTRSPANYRRVQGGWLWDGVLWDETLNNPQLLSLPIHFAQSRASFDNPTDLSAAPFRLPGQLGFKEYASLSLLPPNPRPGDFEMIENPPVVRLKSPPQLARWNGVSGRVSVNVIIWCDNSLAVVFEGKLYLVPYSHFPLSPIADNSLYIEPIQSQFTLNISKSNHVKYQAKGAEKITLELGLSPNFTKPQITEVSKNGLFTVNLRKISDQLIESAVELTAGKSWTTVRREGRGEVRLKEYIKKAAPHYRRITNKKLKGVPILLYAKVDAETLSDEHSLLRHCYLIEVPTPLVREALAP